jgi:hypothetical protein
MNKVIGRWYVVVVGYGVGKHTKVVKIYDTKYVSKHWKSITNPEGYQPIGATYYVSSFMSHQGLLQLNGDVKEWTMTEQEVVDAQAFISML